MNAHEAKKRRRELFDELLRLEKVPSNFNQLERAARVERSRHIVHETFNLRQIGDADEGRRTWLKATEVLHKSIEEAYPPNFWEDIALVKSGDATRVESLVRFLEEDPYFHRSGYVKAELLTALRRVELSEKYKARMRAVILHVAAARDGREFRRYCSFAKLVANPEFISEVQELHQDKYKDVRRRAGWILSSLGSH